jgi:hypothetical protein
VTDKLRRRTLRSTDTVLPRLPYPVLKNTQLVRHFHDVSWL